MTRCAYLRFLALCFGSILFFPTYSWAIPAFARMYGLPCGACHSAFPELNDSGEEFRLASRGEADQ